MAQTKSVGLNERLTSVDDTTGAQLVEQTGGVEITGTVSVREVASLDGWTFLRRIITDDASVVTTSKANITTPFCRLLFLVTGSGSCSFQPVEVVEIESVDVGVLLHEAFKSSADAVSVSANALFTGISARGAVEVNASSHDTIVIDVYVQES